MTTDSLLSRWRHSQLRENSYKVGLKLTIAMTALTVLVTENTSRSQCIVRTITVRFYNFIVRLLWNLAGISLHLTPRQCHNISWKWKVRIMNITKCLQVYGDLITKKIKTVIIFLSSCKTDKKLLDMFELHIYHPIYIKNY